MNELLMSNESSQKFITKVLKKLKKVLDKRK